MQDCGHARRFRVSVYCVNEHKKEKGLHLLRRFIKPGLNLITSPQTIPHCLLCEAIKMTGRIEELERTHDGCGAYCVGCGVELEGMPDPEANCGSDRCEMIVKNNLRKDIGLPPLPLPPYEEVGDRK